MSLLMEALRKAEEAKSKATQDEPDQAGEPQETASQTSSGESKESKESPVDSLHEGNAAQENTLELEPLPEIEIPESEPDQDDDPDLNAPDVISPDPDEQEILAAHSSDSELSFLDSTDNVTESDEAQADIPEELAPATSELTLEKFPEDTPESTTPDTKTPHSDSQDNEPPINNELLNSDQEDDGLSLLESSYFARTKKSGTLGIDDEDLLDDDFGNPVTTDDDSEADTASTSEYQPEDNQSDSLTQYPEASEPEEITDFVNSISEVDDFVVPDDEVTDEGMGEGKDEEISDSQDAKTEEQKTRQSAGSLFLAKSKSRSQSMRKLLPLAAIILILPLGGIVYWFYTSMNSTPQVQFNTPANGGLAERGFLGGDTQLGGDVTAVANTNTDAENTQLELAPQLALEDNTGEPQINALAESLEQPIESVNETTEAPQLTSVNAPAEELIVAPPTLQPANTQAQDASVPTSLADSQDSPTIQAASTGLSFVRTEVSNVIDPDLSAAYDSYQLGDYEIASRLYQQVLNGDPNNRDAILGLASVYLKENNIPLTQNLYVRLLELNPRDPIARAGLLETSMREDPVRQESELKSLLSAYPGVAPLSFALGNLFASQNRWSEAQSAYYNALLSARSGNTGSISPDYAFNLAISLERLNQMRSALDYYREAEEFSRNAVPGFDINLLNQRISTLEQRLP